MDRKKVCKKSSAKKKIMSIELKREIIEKHEQGVLVVDLSRQYGRSTSMICSVLKRKESIKSVTRAKGLTIISKLRTSLHENMEKLLMVWVTENQLQGDTLTQSIICEKARAIYGDLLKQTPQTSIDEASEESFKPSRGWFENFKKRSGIHSVVRHGEAASSDMKAAEDYIKTFSDLIKAQGYISQQVFNCDETGLFWKRGEDDARPQTYEGQIDSSTVRQCEWRLQDQASARCLTHFRNILRGRKKQTSLDIFFSKRPTGVLDRLRFLPIKKMDQRTCIKFCLKNEIKCADAFRMLTVAYGEATLDRSNVYRWYKMFSEGREDVNDEERAGRPSTSTTDEKINEVEKMILANRRITVREVAEDLNISIGSCHSIFINDLGMRRIAAKFVPKLLNCDQKQHRMNIANEMLDSVRDDPNLLQRVITGDEAWVYGYEWKPKLNHLNGSCRTNQDRKKCAKFGRMCKFC
ncbi:hypothetical protein LAZ67_9001124 [Cordylochernes scorpioides]|uniref:HTH CENPB-type domain-containing protein n=1 Tax=Cordylochernes scorpioides TaxID=51811 RepID=A0ABY6KSU0_9ARAC|nr:hypothetical protein LAZ67_9001124 [Cordylochernes scorpioides]